MARKVAEGEAFDELTAPIQCGGSRCITLEAAKIITMYGT
jgi:hypothetical protein